MVEKNEDESTQVRKKKTRIKIQSWDELPQKVAIPEFVHVSYSNGMEVRASDSDIYIDFHELPGLIKDDKLIIRTTRIYMGMDQAQNIANGINAILKKINEKSK
jgi:hypothetical protein